MDNGSGSKANRNLTDEINEIKNLPENKITLNDGLDNSKSEKIKETGLDLMILNKLI